MENVKLKIEKDVRVELSMVVIDSYWRFSSFQFSILNC